MNKPELVLNSDICELMASFVERWCPQYTRREFTDDLWTVVNFEKERCAKIAESSADGWEEWNHPIFEEIAAKIRSRE